MAARRERPIPAAIFGYLTTMPCGPRSIDLEEPEGESKWGSVSSYETGLRYLHDSFPKSKESQIRALEKAITNKVVTQQFKRKHFKALAKWI